jgi:hypothetical protein
MSGTNPPPPIATFLKVYGVLAEVAAVAGAAADPTPRGTARTAAASAAADAALRSLDLIEQVAFLTDGNRSASMFACCAEGRVERTFGQLRRSA